MLGDVRGSAWNGWRGAALLGCAVFAAALLGILTRPLDLLATLWPANAVMLGLLLRMPQLWRPSEEMAFQFLSLVALPTRRGVVTGAPPAPVVLKLPLSRPQQ